MFEAKTYHNFDFATARKRIEPNKVSPYQVHAEDYENINDLIERAIRTKSAFKPEHVSGALYDTDKEIYENLSDQSTEQQEVRSEADSLNGEDVKDEPSKQEASSSASLGS